MFELRILPEVRDWLHELRNSDKETLALISQALTALRLGGPALGRPLVDSIRESRLANMKELRPGSRGTSTVSDKVEEACHERLLHVG